MPIQWLYQSQLYRFKIQYTTTAKGKIQWIREDVLYSQIRFSMTKFKGMVSGVVGEAREQLFKNLMMVRIDVDQEVDAQQVPLINQDRLVNQLSENCIRWSFLQDKRNQFAACKQWQLYKQMYKEQQLREQFIDDSRGLDRKAINAYQHYIEQFQELLQASLHLCSRQPVQALELLGMRQKNIAYSRVRNIFIEEGLVALVATYHKGYRSSRNIKIIHRYLLREVGELLVYYLWLVLPFQEKLQFKMTRCHSSSLFLQGDSRKKEHRQQMGLRQKQPQPTERDGPKQEESRQVGVQQEDDRAQDSRYQRLFTQRQPHAQTLERAQNILKEAAIRQIGVDRLNISGYKQIAIAISRRYC